MGGATRGASLQIRSNASTTICTRTSCRPWRRGDVYHHARDQAPSTSTHGVISAADTALSSHEAHSRQSRWASPGDASLPSSDWCHTCKTTTRESKAACSKATGRQGIWIKARQGIRVPFGWIQNTRASDSSGGRLAARTSSCGSCTRPGDGQSAWWRRWDQSSVTVWQTRGVRTAVHVLREQRGRHDTPEHALTSHSRMNMMLVSTEATPPSMVTPGMEDNPRARDLVAAGKDTPMEADRQGRGSINGSKQAAACAQRGTRGVGSSTSSGSVSNASATHAHGKGHCTQGRPMANTEEKYSQSYLALEWSWASLETCSVRATMPGAAITPACRMPPPRTLRRRRAWTAHGWGRGEALNTLTAVMVGHSTPERSYQGCVRHRPQRPGVRRQSVRHGSSRHDTSVVALGAVAAALHCQPHTQARMCSVLPTLASPTHTGSPTHHPPCK